MAQNKTFRMLMVLVGLLGFVNVSVAGPAAGDFNSRCLPDQKDVEAFKAKVVRTVDGDTVRIMVNETEYVIRMLSIDTPETHYQGKSQGYWGEYAHERISRVLPVGTEVTIELEREKCDKYGRILAHVWKGNININAFMIKQGLAVNYCIYPNTKYCASFARLVQKRVDNREGIFSDPTLELPYEWRRKMSDRPHEKFIGDVFSHQVFEPGSLDEVLIANRVFFMRESQIKLPFHLNQ